MRKQALADTLNEIALGIVFSEHRFHSLEKKYVALRIHGNSGAFA